MSETIFRNDGIYDMKMYHKLHLSLVFHIVREVSKNSTIFFTIYIHLWHNQVFSCMGKKSGYMWGLYIVMTETLLEK